MCTLRLTSETRVIERKKRKKKQFHMPCQNLKPPAGQDFSHHVCLCFIYLQIINLYFKLFQGPITSNITIQTCSHNRAHQLNAV